MAFVWSHPLFRNWATKHKKQMSYSLRKEKITFNEHIVKQGEHASAMYFLLRGSARVSIEPSSHESQYPQFYPLEDPDDIVTREELQLENQYVSVMNKKRENSTLLLPEGKVNMSPSEIRRKEKSLKKQVEVRTITAVEVIGELEFLLDLKTYFQSAICTESCDVFALDIKNYERLLVKRNPRSVALLRDLIELKTVCHLARLHDDQVPLLRTLLFRLKNFQRKKTRQTVRQNGDIRAGAFESSPRGGPPRFTTRTHTNLHETHSRLLNNSLSMGLLSSNLTHHSKDSGNKPAAYGHSFPGSSPFITHEASARYKGSPEGGKEEREIDYFDAASSDRVLSILEARIREWHTTINEDVLLHSPPVSKRETLAPIPLHRFTHKKGKEIKPGTKIVVRRKLQTFQPPKPDEKPPTETPSEPETLPVTSRSTMISPLLKAKAGHGQKYTKEDYRELKRLLQQQQRVYTGSTDKV